jgi:hypothetical protein
VSTAGYVKLLLPPRQSRGNSHWGLAFKNTFLDSDPVSVEQPLPYALAKACTKTAIAAHSNLPTRASRRVHASVP